MTQASYPSKSFHRRGMFFRAWDGLRSWVMGVLRIAPVCPGKHKPIPIPRNVRMRISLHFILPGIALTLFSVMVAGNLWKIQITNHEKYRKEADRLLGFQQRMLGFRGKIFDQDTNLLVGNVSTRDLFMTPKQVDEENPEMLPELCHFLALKLNLNERELLMRAQRNVMDDFSVMVVKHANPATQRKVRQLNLGGIRFVEDKEALDEKMRNITFRPRMVGSLENAAQVVDTLERELELAPGSLLAEVARGYRRKSPLLVMHHLPLETADRLQMDFLEWARVPNTRLVKYRLPKNSIHFEDNSLRVYPKKRLLSNTLGICDADGNGLSGIELLMDKELKRRTGRRHLLLDGKVSPNSIPRTVYASHLDGANIHLTIQLAVQQIVEDGLARLVEKHSPKRAYALMMSPRTGAIMAIAQYPNFDGNDRHTITAENREFHALFSGYEPGSIMKAISVSSAMDFGRFDVEKLFDCENGSWSYGGGRPLHEHGNVRFDFLTVKQIIQKSSNIGSAKVVIDTMNDKDFYHYLVDFGMGHKTQVGFHPLEGTPRWFTKESRGILAPVERWRPIDVSRIAIGHSILVTPFQMVQAYGAIANGGVMMQPYLIDRVVFQDGTVERSVPRRKSQPISLETSQKITECLMTVVQKGGTATSAAVPGYHVAGKTGTAMKLSKGDNGKLYYDRRRNTASFTGFVPAENPAFVLLITADEPSGRAQYGGSVCGTTFSEIALETLKILQVPAMELVSETTAKNTAVR
ncbi:MAG: penicillin-binding protein 2 [Victivallales bacterium]|nr:penicillin-binding protein 2 [Victivallales bacterium]